jgi:hypothetical protein
MAAIIPIPVSSDNCIRLPLELAALPGDARIYHVHEYTLADSDRRQRREA